MQCSFSQTLSARESDGSLRAAPATSNETGGIQELHSGACGSGTTAVVPAVVLHREIQALGYEGGLTHLKMFLAPHKRIESEPVVRFETAPGEQMQADFTHVRRGRDRLVPFVATLGYSRASFVRFTRDETAQTLCECVREALVAHSVR
jgi:hypothetical protein